MVTTKINIFEKDFTIALTVRSFFVHERTFGEQLSFASTEKMFRAVWSMMSANKENNDVPSYDEFLDYFDEHQDEITKVSDASLRLISAELPQQEDGKKKVKQKAKK